MAVNIELLDKALEIIKEHPEHWNQEMWHCGTTHCLAGHVQLIINNLPYDTDEALVQLRDVCGCSRAALNISAIDADVLYYANNTLDDLLRYRDILVQEGSLDDEWKKIFDNHI